MGSAPLAPGSSDLHQHCPCVVLWRHMLADSRDASYTARIWAENTYLLDQVRAIREQIGAATEADETRPAHEVYVLCNCGDVEHCRMERYVSDVRILAAELAAREHAA